MRRFVVLFLPSMRDATVVAAGRDLCNYGEEEIILLLALYSVSVTSPVGQSPSLLPWRIDAQRSGETCDEYGQLDCTAVLQTGS